MSLSRTTRVLGIALASAGLLSVGATTARAQAADPNPGAITLTANSDFTNTYMFRGIRQDDTKVITQPSGDVGLALYSADKGLKSVGLNFGVWNSLHPGDAGTKGPNGKLWYESDFYATLGFGFDHGVGLGATYTAYTSPNNMFSTVKELMFKLSLDDSAYMGKAALKPYVITAFELDTAPGSGQADAGDQAGRYMEIGVGPGYAGSKASIAFPVKVGLSLSNYYELNTGTAKTPVWEDNKFGYLSVAGIVTVPVGGTTSFGAWNVHGGFEFQKLGDTTTAINLGEDTKKIVSFGVGLSY